jgi:Bacterial Ig-like domain (group 2)/Bacterial Ig-like domain (group 3)
MPDAAAGSPPDRSGPPASKLKAKTSILRTIALAAMLLVILAPAAQAATVSNHAEVSATEIEPTLASIAVIPANPSIPEGATQQFMAIGTFTDDSTQNLTGSVTWSSSNTAQATISSTGLATAVVTGTTTIRATSGGVAGSTTLTVTPSPPPTPTPTPTPTPAPTPTPVPGMRVTTSLNVFRQPLPLGLGGIAVPTATVAPLNAAGKVQFMDGAVNLGGPVRVIAGQALGPVSFLSGGPHSLTAVFTPTNPAAFTPSTSNTVTFTF